MWGSVSMIIGQLAEWWKDGRTEERKGRRKKKRERKGKARRASDRMETNNVAGQIMQTRVEKCVGGTKGGRERVEKSKSGPWPMRAGLS